MAIRQLTVLLITVLLIISCNGQPGAGTNNKQVSGTDTIVGGQFENGNWIYKGKPSIINTIDTSFAWKLPGQKLLITGVIYKNDGKTPAPDVEVYYYQTNDQGKYIHDPTESRSMPPNSLGQTHGYIRGWVKSDAKGIYRIYTSRPGAYPNNNIAAHIHLTVKEPNNIREYYIDDIVFDDDVLVNTAYRKKMENRAGSGIVRLLKKDSIYVGERDIHLGLHIPNYPSTPDLLKTSGRQIGEDVFSFTPYHAWGPDKGKKVCPVCKYGWYHGILYFVGNDPDWTEIKKWLTFFENESIKREKYLKVYFIYGNEQNYSKQSREAFLSEIGGELALKKLALTFVPSFSDTESDIHLNHINPDMSNTIILYKRSRIISKYINLTYTEDHTKAITSALDQSINEYFHAE